MSFQTLFRRGGSLNENTKYKRPLVNFNAALFLLTPHPQTTTALSAVVNHSFLTMTTLETSLRPKYL